MLSFNHGDEMSESDPFLKIYVEQLRGGKTWPLQLDLSPDFLEVQETELSFVDPVRLDGEAYLAQDELVIQVSIATKAQIPCRICNELFKTGIVIDKLFHLEPIVGLKRGYFDISSLLREAILLEVPQVAECHGGHCPSRKEVERFLRPPGEGKVQEDEGYRPFQDL